MFRRRFVSLTLAASSVPAGRTAARYSAARHVCSDGSDESTGLRTVHRFSFSGPGVLAHSRALLAPRAGGRQSLGDVPEVPSDEAAAGPMSPYDCTVESVLLSGDGAGLDLPRLVALLADPDAAGVEKVSLQTFAAMTAARQLKAVGGDVAALEVVLGSEVFQSHKDARALRLAGIVNLGKWEEHPDRVPISHLSRGRLEAAYRRCTHGAQRSQERDVLNWIANTIRKAVSEQIQSGAAAGVLPHPGAGLPSAPSLPAAAAASAAATPASIAAAAVNVDAQKQGQEQEVEEEEEEVEVPLPQPSKADVQAVIAEVRSEAAAEAAAAGEVGEDEEHTAEEAEEEEADEEAPEAKPAAAAGSKKAAAGAATATKSAPQEKNDDEDDNGAEEEIKNLLNLFDKTSDKAGKAGAAGASAVLDSSIGKELEDEFLELVDDAEEEEERSSRKTASLPTPTAASAKKAREAARQQEAEEEEEEAVEEEEADEVEAAAADEEAQEAANVTEPDPTLARLSELMLNQCMTADGYLHFPPKELRKDEKRGHVVVTDAEDAMVDPLALFSTFNQTDVLPTDPLQVRVLKETWSSYNAHQLTLEEALADTEARDRDAIIDHAQQKSVEALVYGAVALRAVAREERIRLTPDYATAAQAAQVGAAELPAFGFPLLSSERRPFKARRPRSSLHTDVKADDVAEAVAAYKKYFADPVLAQSPFRPNVACNAGCGVVRFSHSSLHLYETSIKDAIEEEQVRMHFAEALLGVLHAVNARVLPRKVNTLEYHIVRTRVSQEEDRDPGLGSNIVSIDTTAPFTAADRTRLEALAAPLGMTDAVAEFACLEDMIMELEALGVTHVQHLVQSRDDLEVLLTPTLVELLPEAESDEEAATAADAEKADEDEDEEEENAPPPAPKGKRAAGGTKVPAKQPINTRAAAEEDDEDNEEEEAEEEEEEEVAAPPPAKSKKHKQPQQKQRQVVEEEAEEEEEEEEAVAPPPPTPKKSLKKTRPQPVEEEPEEEEPEEEEEEVPPPKKSKHKTVPAKRNAPPKNLEDFENDAEEEEEEQIQLDAEEEEEEEPVPVKPAVKSAKSSKPVSPPRRRAAEEEEEEEGENTEDDEEDEVPPRTPLRSVPAVSAKRTAATPAAAKRTEEWFSKANTKKKRRFFS